MLYQRHPEELSDQPLDDIQFDVENNKLVLESHLQCAAEELPINIDHDQAFFGPNVPQVCEEHLMLIHDKVCHTTIMKHVAHCDYMLIIAIPA